MATVAGSRISAGMPNPASQSSAWGGSRPSSRASQPPEAGSSQMLATAQSAMAASSAA